MISFCLDVLGAVFKLLGPRECFSFAVVCFWWIPVLFGWLHCVVECIWFGFVWGVPLFGGVCFGCLSSFAEFCNFLL